MVDLAANFQDGPGGKGSYLSRTFGIFNEEIVRTWAQPGRALGAHHSTREALLLGRPRSPGADAGIDSNSLFWLSKEHPDSQL